MKRSMLIDFSFKKEYHAGDIKMDRSQSICIGNGRLDVLDY